MSLPLKIRRLGRQPYEPVWRAMSAFTDNRTADTVDELWLLEHDPVFTLGQAGKMEHVWYRAISRWCRWIVAARSPITGRARSSAIR